MEPHLFGTIAINVGARLALINMSKSNFFNVATSWSPTSVHRAVEKSMQKFWSLDGYSFKNRMKTRGFGRDDDVKGDEEAKGPEIRGAALNQFRFFLSLVVSLVFQ